MAVLVDTSVLCRLVNAGDVWFATAERAVTKLHSQGNVLHITAQSLVEFQNAGTRDPKLNGLGLSPAMAAMKRADFEARFPLLVETPAIYPAWKNLVAATGVVGKQVHDARLVAVCHAHGVSHLLTFNVGHFARFSSCAPGLTVLDPTSV